MADRAQADGGLQEMAMKQHLTVGLSGAIAYGQALPHWYD
jgi:hypothetical protein